MFDPSLQKNISRWLAAIAVLLGAASSCVLMVFVGGGWKSGTAGYAAWALMPYAVSAVILVALRFVRLRPMLECSINWFIALVAVGGPLLYVDALFIHPDAQGALAMLMVPLIQAGLLLFASVAGVIWHWRIHRAITLARYDESDSSQTDTAPPGGTRLAKAAYSLFKIALLAVLGVYLLISWLQHTDEKTIDTAREVDFFIHQYCEANGRLPITARLRERFPGLSTDIGWFYFTDDKTWLKVQYPVKWKNSHAIGQQKHSEFTATVYSYVLEYRCGGEK